MSEPLPIWQAPPNRKIFASYHNPHNNYELAWMWMEFVNGRWINTRWNWNVTVHPLRFFYTNTEFYRWLARQ